MAPTYSVAHTAADICRSVGWVNAQCRHHHLGTFEGRQRRLTERDLSILR